MKEWTKPGVSERRDHRQGQRVHLDSSGFDVVYEIIVASGGNTVSLPPLAHRQDLPPGRSVIVDINAVGPGGYFIDFVRT